MSNNLICPGHYGPLLTAFEREWHTGGRTYPAAAEVIACYVCGERSAVEAETYTAGTCDRCGVTTAGVGEAPAACSMCEGTTLLSDRGEVAEALTATGLLHPDCVAEGHTVSATQDVYGATRCGCGNLHAGTNPALA